MALRLPPQRFSRADIVWLAFVVVQVLDGVMSYIGVHLHGPWIEANPLVAWYAMAFGPAVAFTLVKLFAVACGTLLCLTARHRIVAALTVFYVAFAVLPWMQVFALYTTV